MEEVKKEEIKKDDKKNYEETLLKLVKENLELNKELKRMTKRVYRYVIWKRIMFIAKIVFFVFIFFAAVFYLPPFLSSIINDFNIVYNHIMEIKP